jgi:hypothetical protein
LKGRGACRSKIFASLSLAPLQKKICKRRLEPIAWLPSAKGTSRRFMKGSEVEDPSVLQ